MSRQGMPAFQNDKQGLCLPSTTPGMTCEYGLASLPSGRFHEAVSGPQFGRAEMSHQSHQASPLIYTHWGGKMAPSLPKEQDEEMDQSLKRGWEVYNGGTIHLDII